MADEDLKPPCNGSEPTSPPHPESRSVGDVDSQGSSQTPSCQTELESAIEWRDNLNGPLPSIHDLLQPSGVTHRPVSWKGPLLPGTSSIRYSTLTVSSQIQQYTPVDTVHTVGSGSRATTPQTEDIPLGCGPVRGPTQERQHTFGFIRVSAFGFTPKARNKNEGGRPQIKYTISLPTDEASRRQLRPTLKLDVTDRILRADSVALRERKRQHRFAKLKHSKDCAVHFPDWEGVTTEEDRLASCEKIAKELSKVVVARFDEC
jgi:hypothetical protein